jgi:hypothetical protein
MKYIIFKSPNEQPYPVMFPEFMEHAAVAHAIKESYSQAALTPTSAGFVEIISSENVRCYGKAYSLDLRPGEYDEVYLKAFLRTS